jgi:two-component system response regulator FlrC
MITPADLALLPNELEPATAGAPVTPTSMDALEKAAIEQALAATGGNRRLAAERLEIGLRTLYEKLKRYKIG